MTTKSDYTEQELARAREILATEHEKEKAKRRLKAEAFIGRFFKTTNGYGRKQAWVLYSSPMDIDQYGLLYGVVFQHKIDEEGDHGIDIEPHHLLMPEMLASYEEITRGEFSAALTNLIDETLTIADRFHL